MHELLNETNEHSDGVKLRQVDRSSFDYTSNCYTRPPHIVLPSYVDRPHLQRNQYEQEINEYTMSKVSRTWIDCNCDGTLHCGNSDCNKILRNGLFEIKTISNILSLHGVGMAGVFPRGY